MHDDQSRRDAAEGERVRIDTIVGALAMHAQRIAEALEAQCDAMVRVKEALLRANEQTETTHLWFKRIWERMLPLREPFPDRAPDSHALGKGRWPNDGNRRTGYRQR